MLHLMKKALVSHSLNPLFINHNGKFLTQPIYTYLCRHEQITTLETTWLSVNEFTQVAGLQQTDVVSLVEVGVLKPIGRTQNDWSFDVKL